jgi:hypothetical protein
LQLHSIEDADEKSLFYRREIFENKKAFGLRDQLRGNIEKVLQN